MSSQTLQQREITIKFVNDKPKYPRFSNGSVKLTDDSTWMSVAKDIPISTFAAGQTYNVEFATNKDGYMTITNLLGESTRPVEAEPTVRQAGPVTKDTYNEDKNLRIARQGSIQAAIQALSLQVPPEKLFESARNLANQMIAFIETGK